MGIKRYSSSSNFEFCMAEIEDGDYVLYDDIKHLLTPATDGEIEKVVDELLEAHTDYFKEIQDYYSLPSHREAAKKEYVQARTALLNLVTKSASLAEWRDAPDGEGEWEVTHTVEVFDMNNRLRVKLAHPYPVVNNLIGAKWRKKEGR